MSALLPSVKRAIATRLPVEPSGMLTLAGASAMETMAAAVTARSAGGEVTPAMDALSWAVPTAVPVTRPAATDATAGSLDDHVADAVTSCVAPSVSVAVATNARVAPFGVEACVGLSAIETTAAAVTVTAAGAEV